MFSTFEKPHCSVVVRNIVENVGHSSVLPLNVGRSLLDVLAIILCSWPSDGVLQLAIASRMASDKVRAIRQLLRSLPTAECPPRSGLGLQAPCAPGVDPLHMRVQTLDQC